MGGGLGGEWMHVYVWLSPFAVHLTITTLLIGYSPIRNALVLKKKKKERKKEIQIKLKTKKEYWSGLPFPPPGDLPNPGIEAASLASSALAGRFFTTEPPGKPMPLKKSN